MKKIFIFPMLALFLLSIAMMHTSFIIADDDIFSNSSSLDYYNVNINYNQGDLSIGKISIASSSFEPNYYQNAIEGILPDKIKIFSNNNQQLSEGSFYFSNTMNSIGYDETTGEADSYEEAQLSITSFDINLPYFENAAYITIYDSSGNPLDTKNITIDCFNPEDNIIKICTCEDLQNMYLKPNADYEIQNNIDCSDTINWNCNETKGKCRGFISIGNYNVTYDRWGSPDKTIPFTGTLNGKDYSINDLYGEALFRNFGGKLSNVHLVDADIIYSSALAMENYGSIINCSVIGNVNATSPFSPNSIRTLIYIPGTGQSLCIGAGESFILGPIGVGGLVASNTGNISDSFFIGNITGSSFVGGLVGISGPSRPGPYGGDIKNCYANVNIKNYLDYTGGLVGYVWAGSISDSYSTGNLNGRSWIGGLTGKISTGYQRIFVINHSFSDSNIFSSGINSGGMVGANCGANNLSIIDSYWNNNSNSPGRGVGSGLSSMSFAVQNNEAYFKSKNNPPLNQWDFSNSWDIDEGKDFPRLIWEVSAPVNNENPDSSSQGVSGGGGAISPKNNIKNKSAGNNQNNSEEQSIKDTSASSPINQAIKSSQSLLLWSIFIIVLIIIVIFIIILLIRNFKNNH